MPPAKDQAERGAFLFACLAALAVLAVLAAPLLLGRLYVHSDLGSFYLPLKYFYARCLSTGEDFTWCPYLYCGFYLQGEGQMAMLHPLNLLLYQCAPFSVAFAIETVFRYVFLLSGTFLLFRCWHFPGYAAMFGATLFTFSGFNLRHFTHINAVEVVAHLPWLLLAMDVLLRATQPWKLAWAWLATALLTTSQVLYAYPHYLLFSALLELPFLLYLAHKYRSSWQRCLLWSLAPALGVMAGAVQLLPTWESLSLSTRAAPSSEFLYSFALHPANLVQLVAPEFFKRGFYGSGNGTECCLYDGAIATVLAAWFVTRWRYFGPFRGLALVAGTFAAIALVLSLGPHGYLYRLQIQLPLLGLFRSPARYILLIHFGMAIIGAAAVVSLHAPSHPLERKAFRILWVLPVVALVLCVAGLFWRGSSVSSSGHLILGPCLLLIAVALVTLVGRGVPGMLPALIIFSAIDQASYGLREPMRVYFPTQPPQTLDQFLGSINVPAPANDTSRISADETCFFVTHFLRSIDGYVGLPVSRVLDYQDPVVRRIAGVKWVRLDSADQVSWLGPLSGVPYVRLLTNSIRSDSPAEDIRSCDVETTALTKDVIDLPSGPTGSVKLLGSRPGHLLIETTAEAKRLLVVGERHHPGWKLRIDDQSADPLVVYGDFLGCTVPSGTHLVKFLFQPWSLRYGKLLSFCGLSITVVVFLLIGRFSSQVD